MNAPGPRCPLCDFGPLELERTLFDTEHDHWLCPICHAYGDKQVHGLGLVTIVGVKPFPKEPA